MAAINRYRYFYAYAFSMFDHHLVAFVDEITELDHAESTVKLYLSCINDVDKAMHAVGIAACDLEETPSHRDRKSRVKPKSYTQVGMKLLILPHYLRNFAAPVFSMPARLSASSSVITLPQLLHH